jgi:hypothetical protein
MPTPLGRVHQQVHPFGFDTIMPTTLAPDPRPSFNHGPRPAPGLGDDPQAAARAVAGMLFRTP